MLIVGTFLPLFSFLITGIFGRFLGTKGVCIFSLTNMFFCSLIFIVYGLPLAARGSTELFYVKGWFYSSIDWGFLYDTISLEMCFLITIITFCVICYSIEYMSEDPHLIRFLSYLALFSFFMLLPVTSNNFVQMFVGWEGVGFTSYLLINFWFTRLEANRSALKAMIFNRVGDSFYLIGLVVLIRYFGTSDISLITNIHSFNNVEFFFYGIRLNIIDFILFCFFMASVGKSAQLLLHAWLPDAMEGPTPVSSLLHSATMVTAGIFLLIRLSPLFYNSHVLPLFIGVGALTAVLNALFGFLQQDLKKIIAFSTCSQLGLMLVGICYNTQVGFYHLLNHGFFKALLFLSAGSVIHSLHDEQDIRKMGGCLFYLPFTAMCMLVGIFALSGTPFLSGFYSKECLIYMTFSQGTLFNEIIYIILISTSVFTILYSIKILVFIFYAPYFQHNFSVLKKIQEAPIFMIIPMCVLSILSIIFGFVSEDFFIGVGTFHWQNEVLVDLNTISRVFDVENLHFSHKWFLIFFFFSFFLYKIFKINQKKKNYTFFQNFLLFNKSKILLNIFFIFSNKMGFTSLYKIITTNFMITGYKITFILLDRGIFELIGPTQIVRLFKDAESYVKKTQYFFFNKVLFTFIFSVFFVLVLSDINFYVLIFLIFLRKLKCFFLNFSES